MRNLVEFALVLALFLVGVVAVDQSMKADFYKEAFRSSMIMQRVYAIAHGDDMQDVLDQTMKVTGMMGHNLNRIMWDTRKELEGTSTPYQPEPGIFDKFGLFPHWEH